MSAWPAARLGDVADIAVGPAFKSAEFTDDTSDVRLLRGVNVGVGEISWSATKHWPRDRVDGLESYYLQAGDVVVAMDRPWISAGLKVAALGSADVPALLVQRVARLRARPGTEQAFLRAIVRSQEFAEYLRSIAGGTSVPHVSANDIQSFVFRLPPRAAQRRIAAVLSAFDELIEINDHRIEILENLARSLYREWFVRLRFPGYEEARFQASSFGPVPEGWDVRPASEVFEINPRSRRNDSSYPKVAMADLHERYSYMFPSAVVERASGSRFQRHDVLVARITPCLENGKTGLVKFLEPSEVGVGSTEFIVLRGIRVGPAFVYCTARSEAFREHAIKSMSGASGRQRVSTGCFDSLHIVEPDGSISALFESAVAPMFEEVFNHQVHSRRLAATRDLLLPRLGAGRLDTPDLDLGDLLPDDAA